MTANESDLDAAVYATSVLASLAPGQLADARRMGAGRIAPVFWRLAARRPGTIGRPEQEGVWVEIVAALAMLTPKGVPAAERRPLHNQSRRLGAVLCDGGDPAWPEAGTGETRPALSEMRLARLLAARGAQRAVLLRRAAQALARSMRPGSGVNVVDIAHALLDPDGSDARIARSYYLRLDRADAAHTQTQGEAS